MSRGKRFVHILSLFENSRSKQDFYITFKWTVSCLSIAPSSPLQFIAPSYFRLAYKQTIFFHPSASSIHHPFLLRLSTPVSHNRCERMESEASTARIQAELKFRKHVLDELFDPKHDEHVSPFRKARNRGRANWDSFPINLPEMATKLETQQYASAFEFKDDFYSMTNKYSHPTLHEVPIFWKVKDGKMDCTARARGNRTDQP